MQRFALFTLLMLLIVAPATTSLGQTQRGEDFYRSSGLMRSDSLALAQKDLQEKKYSDAIRRINKVLSAYPGDLDALLMRASAYFELGRYDLALADVNGSLTGKYADLRRAEALHLRASIHLASNNKQQALADLKAAIQHKMDYVPAYQFLMQKVSPSEFISIVSETSGNSAGKREQWIPLLFLAFAYEKKGEPMVAVARAVSALRIKDGIPEAHAVLTKYLANDQKRYVEELTSIINAYEQNRRLMNGFPTRSLASRAGVYQQTGRFALALADLDRVLKNYQRDIKTDEHAGLVGLRAQVLAGLNKPDEALSEINRVIASGFRLGGAHAFRAALYCAAGKKTEAKSDEKKAVNLGFKTLTPCN